MPRRREVPSLFDLCTRTIARNLHYYSLIFMFFKLNKRLHRYYKLIQKLIAGTLVDQLRYIKDHENIESGRPVYDLLAFLFHHKMEKLPDVKYMLNFIFNEHSKNFDCLLQGEFAVPDKLLTIISKCKGIHNLRISRVNFSEQLLIKTLGCWTKTKMVSLLHVKCYDSMIEKILKNCLQLEELEVNSYYITDKSLFLLCNDSRISKGYVKIIREMRHQFSLENPFVLCEDPLRCCKLGKKLKRLRILGTRITMNGIACALQHCPFLTEVSEISHIGSGMFKCHLPRSILLLKTEMVSSGQPNLCLRLKTIHFGDRTPSNVMYNAIECCPKLRAVIFDPAGVENMFIPLEVPLLNHLTLLNPPPAELSDSLDKKVKCLQILAISHTDNLQLRNLHNMLQKCTHLNHLILCNVFIENEINDPEFGVPLCAKHLRYVTIKLVGVNSLATRRYLIKLLSNAENLQCLSLSGWLAEMALTEAAINNRFSYLEEITLYSADLKNVSLRNITEHDNQLKTIAYARCSNAAEFVRAHKTPADKNNFDLEILHLEE